MTDSIFGFVELSCRDMWVCSQVHRNTNHFVNTLRIFSCQMLFSVGRIHRTGVWCNVCLAIKVVKMFEFRYVYIFSVQEWQQKKKCTEKLYFAEYFQATTEVTTEVTCFFSGGSNNKSKSDKYKNGCNCIC